MKAKSSISERNDVKVKLVDDYEETIFRDLVYRNLESPGLFVPAWDYYAEGDRSFKRTSRRIRIGAFDGETLIGLSWGEAVSKHRFVMNMSLVEEPYRGQGLYSEMLSMMLRETAAYDEVDSQHQILNNQIIAAKLRRGFHIIGIDTSIMVGQRILLRHYHNVDLLNLMKFRAGLTRDPRTSDS